MVCSSGENIGSGRDGGDGSAGSKCDGNCSGVVVVIVVVVVVVALFVFQ